MLGCKPNRLHSADFQLQVLIFTTVPGKPENKMNWVKHTYTCVLLLNPFDRGLTWLISTGSRANASARLLRAPCSPPPSPPG